MIINGMARLIMDPVVKQLDNGRAVTNLRLSMKMDKKGEDNYYKSIIIDGSVWGKAGELAASSLTKGSRIYISCGSVYDIAANEANGNVYVNINVTIEKFDFVDTKTDNSANTQQTAQQAMPQMPMQQSQAPMFPQQQSMMQGVVQPMQVQQQQQPMQQMMPQMAPNFAAPPQMPMGAMAGGMTSMNDAFAGLI